MSTKNWFMRNIWHSLVVIILILTLSSSFSGAEAISPSAFLQTGDPITDVEITKPQEPGTIKESFPMISLSFSRSASR